MKKLLAGVLAILLPLVAMSDDGKDIKAEVTSAVEAFNTAYATNDVETYFSNYTDDAMLFFYGARQPVSAYHEEWSAMINAGGGVEKNAISDVQVRILKGGNAAVASYFVDNVSRSADGETTSAKAFESDVWEKIDGKWKIVNLHYTEYTPQE